MAWVFRLYHTASYQIHMYMNESKKEQLSGKFRKDKNLFTSNLLQVNILLSTYLLFKTYIQPAFPVNTFNNLLSSAKDVAKIPVPNKTKAITLWGTIQIQNGHPAKIWRQNMPSDNLSKSTGHLSLYVLVQAEILAFLVPAGSCRANLDMSLLHLRNWVHTYPWINKVKKTLS